MAYLPETPEWTDGVYQLEKSDPVRGGVDGPANRPLIDLLKRTAWLKQRYEEAFSGLGWSELGEWAVGLEVKTPSQIVHYQGYWYRYGGSLPHSITGASPSLDDNDNWFNLGNDVSLRANLGSSEEGMGDALVAVRQPYDDAVTRTQHEKNAEFVSITDFSGAVSGRGNDSTAAFVSAYATGLPVYVPCGEWFTSDYRPGKLFGPGVIYSNDSYFTDSGERPQNGGVQTGKSINEHSETWGNKERAVGRSLIINNPDGRVQVSGFSSPAQYATYINSDHVGYYIGMYGPKNQTLTTSGSSTYTSDSLTAPEIVESNDIRVGMFVKTKHSTPYKGKILSVDYDSNTVTVDGWYAQGNTSAGQIPDSGRSALINAADKMWGQNTVIFLEPDSSAVTATGYEMGFQLDTAPGNPVWGFHVVNYSGDYYLNHGYRVTGKFNTGFYIGSSVTDGIQKDVTSAAAGSAILVSDLTDSNWTGSVINLNTNYRKSTSHLAQIRTGGVTHFSIDSRGVRSAQRESVAVISAGTTVTGLSPSILLCNSGSDITVTLSASNAVAGQVFEFRNNGVGSVAVSGITLTTGQYAKFVFDGTSYVLLMRA
ncbi:hypothetical protein [Klebsiella quasipneumoniae]|uniref:hypothetical protein n=2 Tax=Klebsiella quasipneumoniae TaxID=1463165 RepID=UPI0011586909|nr:hypothetical protein [Klebsiella quasipneumoniae]